MTAAVPGSTFENEIARPTPRASTVSRTTRPRTVRGPPGSSSVQRTTVPIGHDSEQMTWMPVAERSIARAYSRPRPSKRAIAIASS